MTLTIYGSRDSRAKRVLWLADELGLAFEHVPLHYTSEARHAPDYLAKNPNGTVPCIDDDGTVLFESLAINLYLARKHASGGLWAANLEEEGQIYQWTLWAAAEAEPHARTWYHHTGFLPEEKRNHETAQAALAQVRKRLGVLNTVLGDRSYLVGERFTVADLNLVGVLQRFKAMGGEEFASASKWYSRCMERTHARKAFGPMPGA